jgi:cytochrome c biogenesis protein CcdA
MFSVGFSVMFIALGAAASTVGQLTGRHTALLSKIIINALWTSSNGYHADPCS